MGPACIHWNADALSLLCLDFNQHIEVVSNQWLASIASYLSTELTTTTVRNLFD
jgi:hypothetical protein